MTQAANQQLVGSSGLLINRVEQVSQDASNVTSQVKVTGTVRNIGGSNINGKCDDGRIDGFKSNDDGKWTYNLDPGGETNFTTQTFTCQHGDRGDLTVNFQVSYGFTGDGSIGNNKSQFTQLVLDNIVVPPTRPQNPDFNNLTSTSLTLVWDEPHDNGGDDIDGYIIERYDGQTASGTPVVSPKAPGRSRAISGLLPGQFYTFLIYADNHAKFNGGHSDPSVPLVVQAHTGIFVRTKGHWKNVAPYIRVNGVWTLGITSVRDVQPHSIWIPTDD